MSNVLKTVMLFLLLFIGQNAWSAIKVVASGDLTSTITWKLVESKTGSSLKPTYKYSLTISGSGMIPDYSSMLDMPWAKVPVMNSSGEQTGTKDYRRLISSLSISGDITRIGARTFNGLYITSVTIPSSCKSIGLAAFAGCSKITDIYIPSSVTAIGGGAFNSCPKLSLIHYDGRCTGSTGIAFTDVASTGKIIEKSGTGTSYAKVPSGWEYYTHGVKCQGGAWVAENADQTKLFFYAKSSGAKVDYASDVVLSEDDQDGSNHPWRQNCYKYTSLEIDKNIAAIGEDELRGYVNRDVTKMGYINMQTITVQSGNSYFVVGEDGALYDKSKTTVYLYPAKNPAFSIEIPSTVTTIRPGAFYSAKNLKTISFLGTINKIGTYAFAEANQMGYMYFATTTAPTDYNKSTSFTGVASSGMVAANASNSGFTTFTKNVGSN